MSVDADSSAPSAASSDNVLRDLVLWRRKKLSAAVLTVATATWVLMEVYQFNFITVISSVAMFVVTSIFLWSNMLKLLGKKPPSLSRLEVTERWDLETANTVRAWIEEGIRWMFRVSAEEEWPVFVGAVAGLWLLTYVGSCVDLLTFLYIGTIVGMTAPVTYARNEDRIKGFREWLKAKCKSSYEIIDEKAIQKIKNRVVDGKEQKKTE